MKGAAARPFAAAVAGRLLDAGHEALFAGGCVRDALLGRAPADYDITTSATPAEVQALFEKTVAVGEKFGVVIVVGARGEEIQVATFRTESGYSDARHPDHVAFASAREDALRRDFTINGMFEHPRTGEVIDYVGGRDDLTAGVLRAIGDPARRFREDHLRLLRAARFAARFGFTIEAATAAAIRTHAEDVRTVSPERIREELTKILTEGAAARGFRLLDELGLLAVVLPEITAMHGVQQPPEFHPEGDVFVHTMLLLEQLQAGCDAELGWGCLLHDVAKPPTFMVTDRIRFHEHEKIGVVMAHEIMTRLKFSNASVELVSALIRDHLKFAAVAQMRESTLKRFLWQERFDLHLLLHEYDCRASHNDLRSLEFCRDAIKRFGAAPPPRAVKLANGDDLIALGLRPSIVFKEILTALDDEILEGRVTTREEALAFLRAEVEKRQITS